MLWFRLIPILSCWFLRLPTVSTIFQHCQALPLNLNDILSFFFISESFQSFLLTFWLIYKHWFSRIEITWNRLKSPSLSEITWKSMKWRNHEISLFSLDPNRPYCMKKGIKIIRSAAVLFFLWHHIWPRIVQRNWRARIHRKWAATEII